MRALRAVICAILGATLVIPANAWRSYSVLQQKPAAVRPQTLSVPDVRFLFAEDVEPQRRAQEGGFMPFGGAMNTLDQLNMAKDDKEHEEIDKASAHCDQQSGIGEGVLFGIFFVVMLLMFNRAFSIKDEVSYLVGKLWEILDGLLNVQQISYCCALVVLFVTFSAMLAMTGFGYTVGLHGRQHSYIRWACHMVTMPMVLVILCDMAMIGMQAKIDADFNNFGPLVDMLKDSKFIPAEFADVASKASDAVGILKSLLTGGIGTDEATGFKAGLGLCAFASYFCLTGATILVNHTVAKWSLFAAAVVFMIPVGIALLTILPEQAARVDPTLIPSVTKLLKSSNETSLIGIYRRLIFVIGLLTYLTMLYQMWHWFLSEGIGYECVSTASLWFVLTDVILYLLPLVLCLVFWPMNIQAVLTLGANAIQDAIAPTASDGGDAAADATAMMAANLLKAAPGNGNEVSPEGMLVQETLQIIALLHHDSRKEISSIEQALPFMPLDMEKSLATPPNTQYNYMAHTLRALVIGSRNNEIIWNLCMHKHIGKSYIEAASAGSLNDVAASFQATIDMLEVHGKLN